MTSFPSSPCETTSFFTKPCKRTIPFLCSYDYYGDSEQNRSVKFTSIDSAEKANALLGSLSKEDIRSRLLAMGGAGSLTDIVREKKTAYKIFYFHLKLPEIKFCEKKFFNTSFVEASFSSPLKSKITSCSVDFIPFTNINDANELCLPYRENIFFDQNEIFNQFLTSSFTIHPNHSSRRFFNFVENFSRIYGYDWFYGWLNQNKQFMPELFLVDYLAESNVNDFFANAINFYSYWEHQTKTNPDYDITTDEKLFEQTE